MPGMADDFHLLDLYSQANAVNRLLKGHTAQEKLAWLAEHGDISPVIFTTPDPRYPETYQFVSLTGADCCFIFSGDEIVFPGRKPPE